MEQADALRGDQRGFLRRLGEHGVARDQGGGDLSDEDREREVPRADARHHAQRRGRGTQRHARLLGIIAQEVDRLAHLCDGIGQRLARLAHDQRQQLRHAALHRVGSTVEDRGALSGRQRGPAGRGGLCGAGGGLRLLDRHLMHRSHPVAVIGGVQHRARSAEHACVPRPLGSHRLR